MPPIDGLARSKGKGRRFSEPLPTEDGEHVCVCVERRRNVDTSLRDPRVGGRSRRAGAARRVVLSVRKNDPGGRQETLGTASLGEQHPLCVSGSK